MCYVSIEQFLHSEPLFLPIENANSISFYGTKHLYSFLRFFYTIKERLLKAWELSNFFEENTKTKLLTKE